LLARKAVSSSSIAGRVYRSEWTIREKDREGEGGPGLIINITVRKKGGIPMSHRIACKERSMEGVVMRFRPSLILTITLLVLSMGLFYESEAKTVDAGHATVSWKGKGVIEDLGDGGRFFSGTLTGTILVKHLPEGSEPAQIHKTKMECKTIFYISRTIEQRKTVLCILRAHEGKDLAYVEIRCAGKTGDCKGDMKWVWGEGGFKGITGTTPFISNIYFDKENEGEIYGSAHWPYLTYTVP
jgi:hypothetical protein